MFSPAYVLLIACLDIPLYIVLTWYFEQVWASQYGSRKPFYFCFTPRFWTSCFNDWCGSKSEEASSCCSSVEWEASESYEEFTEEAETEGDANAWRGHVEPLRPADKQRVAIQVRRLVKTFSDTSGGPPVRAVDGLNLDMLDGQITALLGHNGRVPQSSRAAVEEHIGWTTLAIGSPGQLAAGRCSVKA